MADHDYVCGASGLTIGYQPVRVLLLAEADYPEPHGLKGRFYPLAPAIKAEWNRDGNEPYNWDEGTCYRLAHEAFKVGLSSGRNREMPDLLEQLPGGLTMRQIDRSRKEHPDSYKIKLGKMRAAPWIPTPKRVLDVLKAAGLKAYASKVSYGNIRVSFGWDKKDDTGLIDKAEAALAAAGYVTTRNNESTYGLVLVVRPGTAELTIDDVRAALSSGGWPEGDPAKVEAEPVFEATTHKIGDREFTFSAEQHRKSWLADVKGQGFRVEAFEGGFRVFHCVNGVDSLEAKCISSYYSRLRCCGIACRADARKELEGRFAEVPVGPITVPTQSRSFEALVTQRRVRFMDNMADRYARSLHHRTKRFVTWAVIREDVWQALLKTQATKGYNKGDDGLYESRRALCAKAFEKTVGRAKQELKSAERDGYVWGTVERALDAGGRDYDMETCIWQDPPFRIGLKWTFVHLAVMVARGEIERAEADKAVEEYAELSHVQNVLADLEHQWKEPHMGYQSPDHEVMAKVRTDWARIARADAKREKQRRAAWDK